MASANPQSAADWWRSAVVYQVYPRSFADGNGDGIGDIAGLRQRLQYLAELGVDAIWINPWYPSPMKDAGYDVSDFRDIEPTFGTLAEAEAMIGEAHALGLKVLLDIVPNHTSDQHVWFQQALQAGPGSPERARYIFRDGRGPNGDEPPNDWISVFGGEPAWTRITEADGKPGQWYLRLFAAEQPDVDWEHPEVRAEYESVLRFWFDRGVDGFRIDVAHGLVKADGLPDIGERALPQNEDPDHPHWDRPGVHAIYRAWRELADAYDPPRVFVAEAWVSPPERLVKYVRADELHTSFNFDFLVSPWQAAWLRATIDRTIESHAGVGAPPTWVLSNHDVVREVSRYARPDVADTTHRLSDLLKLRADFALGLQRARAAALLMFALPGGAYVYQGEELGLPEVEDLPDEVLQDPTFVQTGGEQRGRDGCRVPLPWSGQQAPFGFSPDGATQAPWLPQPASWAGLTAEAQRGVAGSTLELFRAALQLRRSEPALGDGELQWLPSPDGVLAFSRGNGFVCIVNVSAEALPLPAGATLLLASEALDGDWLPTNAAAWLRTQA
ncbi:alpha-glucosidase [Plasticicumulans lactativorans]|uniref:Alpha-glucosidase n=1 Tax=Plasticicumulans lactativorans TaxID=1133106 RepID=A0A4R2LCX0_9GAMM|nr:glycoside hydrolase family 13 protein [Plasticicumulans lactativorans]TCO82359.1 alpha-glucosidase [Plasticicumulans lactativorans]